jgi:predicted permease
MKQRGFEWPRAIGRVLGDARRDARHGVRLLVKSPVFTAVAVVALAVGIGANLTIFGFVNALLLRPLPAAEPDRLIRADRGGPNAIENGVVYDDYLAYRDRTRTLSHLAFFHPGGILPVRIGARPAEPIQFVPVTGNYFDTLGVRAVLGRTFTADDDREGAGSVVLSHAGWTRHFNADPGIVGQTILIDRMPFSVVGVTGAQFTGTVAPVIPQMYATWRALPRREMPSGFMIGRLLPEVSIATAQADFGRIASQLSRERNQPVSVAVYPAHTSMPGLQRVFALFSAVFMLIVGAVLWSACSNVALLHLVRSAARRREMAVRLAIGATRLQLVRQLLVENLLLAVLAGMLGTWLAYVTARWLTQIPLPVPMPIALTFAFDWRVLMFAVAISVVATMLSGLTAALDARRSDPAGVLREDPTARPFARMSLIVTQVALTAVLLVVATALTRSLTAPPDRQLDANGVIIATVSLPQSQYGTEQATTFFERLQVAAGSARGVTSATIVETIPLVNNRPMSSIDVVRSDSTAIGDTRVGPARALVNHVSPGHFRTLGIPLMQGRDFTAQDDARALRVAIVNETAARRFWAGASVVGQVVRLGSESATIIAVANDSKYESLTEAPKAMVYRPLAQAAQPVFEAAILMKSSGDPRVAFSLARSLVASLDPNLVVTNLNTLDDRLGLTLLANRAAAITSGLLGIVALGLGAIGTYSVIAFLVLQRRREMGIRIALGASPGALVDMMTRQGLRSAAVGLAIGIAAGAGALRLVQGLIVGVRAADPVSFALVSLLLGTVAYLACVIPARQIGRGDPLAALRE